MSDQQRNQAEMRPGVPSDDAVSNTSSQVGTFNPDELLTFGAKQIISLFVPVTVCMFFVVLVATTVDFYGRTDVYLIYTPFHTPDADLGTRTWQTLANTLIFMSVIVVMTCILVVLFKYHCYRIIHGWLILTTFMLLFLISFLFFTQAVRAMGIFVDYITMAFILWNFGVAGMLVIHWRGPLILQQAYLIFISAQIALLFLKYLPKWTCWVLLGALAIWDLIAVLCPRGPLRMLLEMAHERDQPLFPALLYSTTAVYLLAKPSVPQKSQTQLQPSDTGSAANSSNVALTHQPDPIFDSNFSAEEEITRSPEVPVLADLSSTSPNQFAEQLPDSSEGDHLIRRSHTNPLPNPERSDTTQSAPRMTDRWIEMQADLRDREKRGVKLGLGDFVFYSLLIGRATLDGDPITVATCYVAILVGMCVTIIVLVITRRALPALPISIACGILFYFVTSVVISPFLEALAADRLIF
ncbi:presenilin 1 [Paragonimus westermani]|uniref:Presenilin n=1 Tax=Paragonimus westermani TaxID=34504 RepID=A0A5J4NJK8_9TREM|nr:presenilin 1 [Paragonimus westermani]